MVELRKLLLGPEQEAIGELKDRLDDPRRRASEVSAVLPDAISTSTGERTLQPALTPSVEETIRLSIKRDPQVLVNAIFPVIGPAIRKSITETFTSMIESLNTLVESTCSVRGLRWRFEAYQSGRPFAEVALLHTLDYSLEEIFLIHAETGLLLEHVVDPTVPSKDAQTVSAMLAAIRDFVKDSFDTGNSESLDGIRLGELNVLVEPGPQAFIVGVVRGNPPEDLREPLKVALEQVHHKYGRWLEDFDGDNSQFQAAIPLLEACLLKRYAIPPETSNRMMVPAVILGVLVTGFLILEFMDVRRWSGALSAVDAQAGIIVLDSDREFWRQYRVEGLRDPMANDPETLFVQYGIEASGINARWHTFYSDAPEFVVARSARLLEAPDGVSFEFENGRLTASGTSDTAWATEARRLAALLPGVVNYDDSSLSVGIGDHILELAAAIEASEITFASGEAFTDSTSGIVLTRIGETFARLLDAAGAENLQVGMEVVGHTDGSGDRAANILLGENRARAVADSLRADGIDTDVITIRAVGDSEPVADAVLPVDPRNRRVTFEITLNQNGAEGAQ